MSGYGRYNFFGEEFDQKSFENPEIAETYLFILSNTGSWQQVNNFNLGRGMHHSIFRDEIFFVVHNVFV